MKFPKIQIAWDSGLFAEGLRERVNPPNIDELDVAIIARRLSSQHIELLSEWGGSNLEELRILGLHSVRQVGNQQIVFADDPSGFTFFYDKSGIVYQCDSDGGDISKVADSIRSFIDEVFLGPRAAEIYGNDWLNELRKRNLV